MAKKTTHNINVRTLLTGIVAENTIARFETAWKAYMEYAKSMEAALDAKTLTTWRAHMINDRNYAASTINVNLRGIRCIVKQLYLRGKAQRDVYYDMKEVNDLPANALIERRRPNNRTKVEPEQMRELCKLPPVSPDNHAALRDRALMMTLATTGARISEVVNIKFEDIKKAGSSYVVTNIMGKGQSQARTAPLSTEAYEAIRDYIELRDTISPYVFANQWGRPMDRNQAGLYIKQYGNQLGLTNLKPHDFRRFVGTQIIKKAGVRSAQKVLGHANINTTASYYDMDDFAEGITESLF